MALIVTSRGRPTLDAEHPRHASTKSKNPFVPSPKAYRPSPLSANTRTPLNYAHRKSKGQVDAQDMLEFLGHIPKPLPKPKAPQKEAEGNDESAMVEQGAPASSIEAAKLTQDKPTGISTRNKVTRRTRKAVQKPSITAASNKDVEQLIAKVAKTVQDKPIAPPKAMAQKTPETTKKPALSNTTVEDVTKVAVAKIAVTGGPMESTVQEGPPGPQPSPEVIDYLHRQMVAQSRESKQRRKWQKEEDAQRQREREHRKLEILEELSEQEADYERWESEQLKGQRANARSTYLGVQEIFAPVSKSWRDIIDAMKRLYIFHDKRWREAGSKEATARSTPDKNRSVDTNPDSSSNSSLVATQTLPEQTVFPMSRHRRERLYWICQVDSMIAAQGRLASVSHDYRSSYRDRKNLTEPVPDDWEGWGAPSSIRLPNDPLLTARLVGVATRALATHCQELMRDFRSAASWRPLDAFGPIAHQMEADLNSKVVDAIVDRGDANTLVEPGEGNALGFDGASALMLTNPLRLALLGGERFVQVWHMAEVVFREGLWLKAEVIRTSGTINRLDLSVLEAPSIRRREERLQIYHLWIQHSELLRTFRQLLDCAQEAFKHSGSSRNGKLSRSSALLKMKGAIYILKTDWGWLSSQIRKMAYHLSLRATSMPAAPSPITTTFRIRLYRLWRSKIREDERRDMSVLNRLERERSRFAGFWISELGKLPPTPRVERVISEMKSEQIRRTRIRSRTGRAVSQSQHSGVLIKVPPIQVVRESSEPQASLRRSQRHFLAENKAQGKRPTIESRQDQKDSDSEMQNKIGRSDSPPRGNRRKSGMKLVGAATTSDAGQTTRKLSERAKTEEQQTTKKTTRAKKKLGNARVPSDSDGEDLQLGRNKPMNDSGIHRQISTSVPSKSRPTLERHSSGLGDKSSYHSSATSQASRFLTSCGTSDPQISDWSYDDELDEAEFASTPSNSGDSPSNADEPIDRKALEVEELDQPVYRIPDDDRKRDLAAYNSGRECYWSHLKYRGPNGRSPSVRYCTTLQQSEEVAQIFAEERVIGFDMEWKVGGSSIKEHLSVIQIACDATIGVFHLALYKGDAVDELIGPSLRGILVSPDVLKTGVNIGQDFKRVHKYLGIMLKGCFELSRLHNLVTLPPNAGKPSKRLVSLAKQVEQHLVLPLRKDDVRTSDWSKRLNYEQVKYAAADAYAGYRLFHELEEKRCRLPLVPPRPDTIDTALRTSCINDPKPTSDTNPVDVPDEDDTDTFPEPDRSSSSVIHGAQLNTDKDASAAALPTDSARSKRPTKKKFTPDEGFTEMSATKSEEGDLTTPDIGDSSSLIAYPDLTTHLQSLGIEEAITVATQYSEAQAAVSLHLSSADAWIDTWMQGLPEGAKPNSRRRQLQAYALWHQQGMSVHRIAGVLKTPPLSPNTVISYILDVIRDEGLPFDTARLRDLLPKLHQDWVQRRYWSLLKRLE